MRAICASLLVNQKTAVRSATGTSKTHTAAGLMLYWLDIYRPTARVISTAKTMRQVEIVLWAQFRSMQIEVRERFQGARPDNLQFYPDKENYPKWMAVGYNPKVEKGEATAFQGQHSASGHVLFVFEEANTIDKAVFEAAEGSLDAENARILAIFNPNVARGVVHEWERTGEVSKERGNLITISRQDLFDDPLYPQLRALGGLPTPERTAKMVALYGASSPIVRVKVHGEYPLSDSDAAITLDTIEAAITRSKEGLNIGTIKRMVLGWDVAGEGEASDDNSLGIIYVGELGYRFRYLVPEWHSSHTDSLTRVNDVIEKLKQRHWVEGGEAKSAAPAGADAKTHQSNGGNAPAVAVPPAPPSIELIVDAIGEGSHVPSFMRKMQPKVKVTGFKGGNAATGIKHLPDLVLANLNSEAWYYARILLTGDYYNPLAAELDEQAVHELTSRKQSFDMKRGEPLVWAIESKPDWRSRSGGKSPDRADAFIMAVWGIFKGTRRSTFDWATTQEADDGQSVSD